MMEKNRSGVSAVAAPSNNELYGHINKLFLATIFTAFVVLGLHGTADAADSDQAAQIELESIPFNGLVNIDGAALTDAAGIGEGQWTLVMIWATSCHICQEQKPLISAFHNAHKDTNAKVFGIALDGEPRLDVVKKYMDRYEVAFPTYVGDFQDVAESYQQLSAESLRGTPTYLLFDPSGELKGNNPGAISVEAVEKFMARHSQ